mmetsp:Transcript_74595/g.159855  ORF Transcript_74595/g.159855 Transcript_74595/m.159855 type:complete len:324 (+) Transcript_74595:124-1095(+)
MAKMALSSFELLSTLGKGGFGVVKLARHKADGKFYAVKFMEKHAMMKSKQVDHVNMEKKIMSMMEHPFIVNLLGYTKDERYVMMIMECISGGELFRHLRIAKKFSDDQAMFYAALVAIAFEYIHAQHVAHRDIKPENILMCSNGYLKITDFGLAKLVAPGVRSYTVCGTPDYMAPEVLLNKGHCTSVDWWSLGVLIYEMLVGQPPFSDEDASDIYRKILAGRLYFPRYFSKNARNMLKKLLHADLSLRYGNLKDGARDVLEHKWFAPLDLEALRTMSAPPPMQPKVKDASDISNFDSAYWDRRLARDPLPPEVPPEKCPFKDW